MVMATDLVMVRVTAMDMGLDMAMDTELDMAMDMAKRARSTAMV